MKTASRPCCNAFKLTLHFLERLSRHNEREWFNAHKEEYVKAREGFTALTGQVLDGIRRFDDRIGLLDPAACCYRIYRDPDAYSL